ncbi:MAG: hypothetical protein DSY89_02035, partial [Deltaproteobacteria bacterium]
MSDTPQIRKIYSFVEETHADGKAPLTAPTRKAAVAVVFKNPFAGIYQEDLSLLYNWSETLGTMLTQKAVAALGIAPEAVHSYGKGAIVGADGELEHCAAMMHPALGKPMRDNVGGGKALIPPLFLIVAVLGSIFAGIASPTEAAAVGSVGAVLLAIANRKFSMAVLKEVMSSTTKLTCMVFIILVGAQAFGLTFRELDGDTLVRGFLFSIEHKFSTWMVLAIVMGVIFLVGFVLDFIEITFIH